MDLSTHLTTRMANCRAHTAASQSQKQVICCSATGIPVHNTPIGSTSVSTAGCVITCNTVFVLHFPPGASMLLCGTARADKLSFIQASSTQGGSAPCCACAMREAASACEATACRVQAWHRFGVPQIMQTLKLGG